MLKLYQQLPHQHKRFLLRSKSSKISTSTLKHLHQNQPQQPVGSEYRSGSNESKIFNYFGVEIKVRLFSEHPLTWMVMGTSRRKNL